ncbi:uncharacterized protein LOC116587922 [Mustela erminea]|uniref:uncharacterized protein LOC116587922 n=1 Tax=Mustela erminea TaxID=36723 RepID=UPI001386D8A8|nr:uncharacterized protein LOC116587922 [Mustela erminea]
MGMFNECIKPFDHPRSVGFSSAGRAGLGAQRLDHLQPPAAVPRTAPLLPRPRSARPGLLSQLPLPLLPVQARSVLRLGSKWMWESRLRAGDLGEAFGARSVQRPLEDESGGGPRPTPSSCPSRGGRRSIRAPPQSLVGDRRGHGRDLLPWRKSLLKERICVWNKVVHLLAFCCMASIYQTRRICLLSPEPGAVCRAQSTYIFPDAAGAQVQRHLGGGASQRAEEQRTAKPWLRDRNMLPGNIITL